MEQCLYDNCPFFPISARGVKKNVAKPVFQTRLNAVKQKNPGAVKSPRDHENQTVQDVVNFRESRLSPAEATSFRLRNTRRQNADC